MCARRRQQCSKITLLTLGVRTQLAAPPFRQASIKPATLPRNGGKALTATAGDLGQISESLWPAHRRAMHSQKPSRKILCTTAVNAPEHSHGCVTECHPHIHRKKV